ncbi:MAG: DUF4383 domain-containing protein [Brachybacterium sp.]|nr:DUF4383 domain-containing protein [Brachybacterium sp.]MDN5899758.1 DUF4383 domain-containing protein [Brachybacterium sp.]
MITDPTTPNAAQMRMRSPVQVAALFCGIGFFAIGFAGFVPVLTMNFNSIEMATDSDAMLLGIFQVSVLHNVIYLLLGIAGLGLSRLPGMARWYLRIGGIVNALLWIFGLFVDKDSTANFVPINIADDWLYFVLALTLIGLSFLPGRPEAPYPHGS